MGKPNPWNTGVQAVAPVGRGLVVLDECNCCTLKRIREKHGMVVLNVVDRGVEVLVHGVPLIWFDAIPERCNCEL